MKPFHAPIIRMTAGIRPKSMFRSSSPCRPTTAIGRMTAAIPRTSSRFITLDPTAFPTLRAPLPRIAARTDTMNSGIDVPKPTTVRPTTIGETPKRRASREAPSTSHEAPSPKKTIPTVTRTNGMARSYRVPHSPSSPRTGRCRFRPSDHPPIGRQNHRSETLGPTTEHRPPHVKYLTETRQTDYSQKEHSGGENSMLVGIGEYHRPLFGC